MNFPEPPKEKSEPGATAGSLIVWCVVIGVAMVAVAWVVAAYLLRYSSR